MFAPTSFAQLDLNPLILKALDILNHTAPTPVQAAAIPKVLAGKDLIAKAPTGTGKTGAFVLPILHLLALPHSDTRTKPRVLILTPTRELATQITKAIGQYGKFLNPKLASLLGGMPYYQQIKSLSRPVDIIIATPGRLMDHMNQGLDLSQIEILVLDEADRMLDMGFIKDVKDIAKATPASRQTLLFSATTDEAVIRSISGLLKDPERVDLSSKIVSPTHIKQTLYMADSTQHKARLFQHFLANESIFKAIIFSATKINTDRLAKQLEQQGYAVSALHGGLRQSVRNRTIDQFHRKGQLLVATDVAARGIDIANISHVINYDLPKFCEDYVHRIGRTGRAGKSGIAISFGLPTDDRNIVRIERFIGQRFERATIEGMEPSKQILQQAHSDNQGQGRSRRAGGGFGSAPRRPAAPNNGPRSYARAGAASPSRSAGGYAKYTPKSDQRAPIAFDSRQGDSRFGVDGNRAASSDARHRDSNRAYAPRSQTSEGMGRSYNGRPGVASASTGYAKRAQGGYYGQSNGDRPDRANTGPASAQRNGNGRPNFSKPGQKPKFGAGVRASGGYSSEGAARPRSQAPVSASIGRKPLSLKKHAKHTPSEGNLIDA